MSGAFVAATIVSLIQFLRVGDRRLLLLAAMFGSRGGQPPGPAARVCRHRTCGRAACLSG
jgi:hypothetical protein